MLDSGQSERGKKCALLLSMANFHGANIPTMVYAVRFLDTGWEEVHTIRSCEQAWTRSDTPLVLGFLRVSSSLSAWLCNMQQSNRHSRSTCCIPRWCVCSWEMLREEEISSNTQLRGNFTEILQSKCLPWGKVGEDHWLLSPFIRGPAFQRESHQGFLVLWSSIYSFVNFTHRDPIWVL